MKMGLWNVVPTRVAIILMAILLLNAACMGFTLAILLLELST